MLRIRWIAVMSLGAISVALAPMPAAAQGRDTPAVENRQPPKGGTQPGKNVPPGKEHGTAEQLYSVCLSDLNECNVRVFALGQQVKALEAQLAKLAPLPVCWDRHIWKHPTIADVNCYPHACATNAYACVMKCNSKLDCAPGRSCTAQGHCEPPIK